jgi:2-hydroxychromene-2-carboxylate isomerase
MSLLLFLSLVVSVASQVATPPRKVGFQYLRGNSTARVQLEVFLDLVCPDSKATWPHVKDVANHYGPQNVELLVHLFPLPYHQNAFYLSRATYVVHYLTKGNRTFDWIDKVLLNKSSELTDGPFHDKSDADLLTMMSEWVSEMGLNKTAFLGLADRRVRNDFEVYTRRMWKMACTRGVAGTPMYFINGINHPNILQSWTLAEWKLFLDPLVAAQLFDDIDEVEGGVSQPVVTQAAPCDDGASSTTPMAVLVILLSTVVSLSRALELI